MKSRALFGPSPCGQCAGSKRFHRKTRIEAEAKFYSLSKYPRLIERDICPE
jgi:hypothetical protein